MANKPEPEESFCEIVRVKKYFVEGSDVTIFYISKGRGEFQISGGIIFREQREGRDRRLTIVTSTGDTFDISRHHRGGYSLHSRGYQKEELHRIYP